MYIVFSEIIMLLNLHDEQAIILKSRLLKLKRKKFYILRYLWAVYFQILQQGPNTM